MLKTEKDRILLKLDEMENYLTELDEMLPKKKEYLKDLINRRACEKTIGLAIESLIDACSMVISFYRLGIPSDEDNIFEILIKKNVITGLMGKQLREIKGFRNILIHKYGVLDDALVYEFISTDLIPFVEFKSAVVKYLIGQENNGKN